MGHADYSEKVASGISWLDSIPSHWDLVRLRRVLTLNPSKSEIAAVDRETHVSFLPMEAVGEDGSINLERSKPVASVENGYTYFRNDDVIIAKITPCFENGKGAVLRGLLNGIGFGTTELIVARPRRDRVTSEYLQWLFNSAYFRKFGEATMYGAGGQKRVPDEFVRNFEIAIPPLDEQLAIANFLDRETSKIDALISEQRRLIELLKEKRQAVISHAVTKGLDPNVPMKPSGIEWLGDVPVHWSVPPVFARYYAVLGKMVDEKQFTGKHPTPYLRNADVNWDTVNTQDLPMLDIQPHELERFTLRPGDLLICEGGAGVGQTAIWNGEIECCAFQKALHRLRPWNRDAENPRYFYYCMRYMVESGVALSGGTSTIPHLTGEQLRKYRFPCPPIQEQSKIATYLDRLTVRFDQLSRDAEQAISILQERRTALISAAVTGKIDVREAACQGAA